MLAQGPGAVCVGGGGVLMSEAPGALLLSQSHTAKGESMPFWVTCAAVWVMVTSSPGLLPTTMSRSLVLLQLGAVLLSLPYVATRVHVDTTYGHEGCAASRDMLI